MTDEYKNPLDEPYGHDARRSAASRAAGAARVRLRNNHWDEWQTILAEERKLRGLPPVTNSLHSENSLLRQRIKELEEKMGNR